MIRSVYCLRGRQIVRAADRRLESVAEKDSASNVLGKRQPFNLKALLPRDSERNNMERAKSLQWIAHRAADLVPFADADAKRAADAES